MINKKKFKKGIIEMDRDEKGEFIRNLITWDSQKLAIESKRKLDEYTKTGEGRFFAEYYLLGQILLLKNEQSSFFKDYDRYKGSFTKLLQMSAPSMLQNYLFNGKVFILANPVYELLKNTSNKAFLRKHPFPIFAVDSKIKTKYEGLNIIFIMFFEVFKSPTSEEVTGCNYLAIGEDERDNSEFFVKGTVDDKSDVRYNDANFAKEEEKELRKMIDKMYANFLDYLNHPYSKQTIYELSYNNLNRIKRGKFPQQDKIIIDIKPEFIDYNKVDETTSHSGYVHSFWVRGHFKHFRNRERYKKLYNLTKKELEGKKLFYNGKHISKWVIPYIKGIGKLKEKIRRLT